MIGPYALMMPVADVQNMRDRFQQIADDTANATLTGQQRTGKGQA